MAVRCRNVTIGDRTAIPILIRPLPFPPASLTFGSLVGDSKELSAIPWIAPPGATRTSLCPLPLSLDPGLCPRCATSTGEPWGQRLPGQQEQLLLDRRYENRP